MYKYTVIPNFKMCAYRYQRITTNNDNEDNNDNISSDDSILDMNNTNTSNIANNYNDNYEYDDNILLLPNNNTSNTNTSNTNIRQNRDRRNTNQHQTQTQTLNHGLIIQSPTYRNYLIKKIFCNVFVITLFASVGLAFVICGFKETTSYESNDIFNINAQYSFYYFSILLSFYIFYISVNILTIIIAFLASLNGNASIKILLLNGTLFQLTLIIKLFIMVVLCVQLIDNTPMLILNINISGVVNNTVVDVYIPKHIQYMIIEIIIYSCISYCIGFNNGMIRLL
jgi:hypothetical protein